MAHTEYGFGFRVRLTDAGRVSLSFQGREGELSLEPGTASDLALNILTVTGDLRAQIEEPEGEPALVYVSTDPTHRTDSDWLAVLPLLRGERPAS